MSLLLELHLPSLPAPQSHCASAPDVVLLGVTCLKHYISQDTCEPQLNMPLPPFREPPVMPWAGGGFFLSFSWTAMFFLGF